MRKKTYSTEKITRRNVLKSTLYGGLLSSIAPCLFIGGCQKSKKSNSPNIFLLTVDTLRADHLGCYGYSANTSPNIDRFANENSLFEKCFSHAPITCSSFASILSGMYPHETKVLGNLPLPRQVLTLPEIFQQNNYTTAAVVSNFALRGKKGWSRCFTKYDDNLGERELNRSAPERTASNTTKRAIELLKKYHQKQLFMWVHYQDPHGPYTPPKKYGDLFLKSSHEKRELKINKTHSGYGGIPSYQKLADHTDYKYYVSQYDSEIRYYDEQINLFIEALKEYGQYENSVIILTSDHGEGMGEKDYYFAHGENLDSGLTHIPLIMKYGNEFKGRRQDFVQHCDLVPTILALSDIKPKFNYRGGDLRQVQNDTREIFAEMDHPELGAKYSILTNGLKLIYNVKNDSCELYDLRSDFNETIDLSNESKYADQLKKLKNRLSLLAIEDIPKLDIVNKPSVLTEDEAEVLRSLGYVQ
jgi:arylsulfatase A-like enzyme